KHNDKKIKSLFENIQSLWSNSEQQQFMNKLTNLNFFLIWIFGFFVLLSFDLFVEGFVFEWLEWNGTNKNDWFFVLWWGLVVVWFLKGSISLYQRLKNDE
ncbi:MAG: hypothetical protein CMQ08_13410, partial [Gammaproteobacteria bacterium]|nr:hypothetical protein [Gammaproteobacteria bacterium]